MISRSLAGGRIVAEAPDGMEDCLDLAEWSLAQVLPGWDWAKVLRAPVRLLYVADIAKPSWAEGLTRADNRVVRVVIQRRRGVLRRNRMSYIGLHELAGHMVDHDHLDGRRGAIRSIMVPKPTSWNDVDGLEGMASYWHLPSEAYANRIVEAMTEGRVSSPFDDDYTRTIREERLRDLLAIVMAEPNDGDEDPVVVPTPTPPEPEPSIEELRQEVVRLTAVIAAGAEKVETEATATRSASAELDEIVEAFRAALSVPPPSP